MNILKKIKDIFKPRAYSIYIASDYTTIVSNGEVLDDVFAKVLDKYYNSSRCELTLKMLQAPTEVIK